MTVLLATTTVTVLRRGADADDTEGAGGYVDPLDEDQRPDSAEYVAVVTGVSASISAPSGSQSRLPSGTDVRSDAYLIADPCDLHLEDVILDERTGLRYTMGWCVNYDGPGHLIKSSQAALTRFSVGD